MFFWINVIDRGLLSNKEIIVGDLKEKQIFFQGNVKGKMHSEMLMTINLLVCVCVRQTGRLGHLTLKQSDRKGKKWKEK